MIRNFRKILNKGTFSFLYPKLKVVWQNDGAHDDPFWWGWQVRAPPAACPTGWAGHSLAPLFQGNLLSLLQCSWAFVYVSSGIAGERGIFSPSYSFLVLEAGLTSVFLREMPTPRCKGNTDSYFAMAWHFPKLTALGLSNAGFPEGCQRPKKRFSMRVLVA